MDFVELPTSLEELLIDMVRDRPWLYDSSLRDYKDAEKKENSWKKISECLKLDVNEVKRKWKNLQSSYVRERKLGPSGTAAKKKKEWVHMAAMSFMYNHSKEKKQTYGNIFDETIPTSQVSETAVNSRLYSNEFFTEDILLSEAEDSGTERTEMQAGIPNYNTENEELTTAHLWTTKTRRKRKNDAIIQALENTDSIIKKMSLEENEDDHFCELLKYHLKGLNREKKLSIHLKILNAVEEEINKD